MASRRPKMSQLDLARATGIGQSQLSRMLAPTKPMFVEEFIAICRALSLDPMTVIREAERRVLLHAVEGDHDEGARHATPTGSTPGGAEPAQHSSPASAQDIAAGATLPMQGGRPRPQRRSRQTSDTTEKHHK